MWKITSSEVLHKSYLAAPGRKYLYCGKFTRWKSCKNIHENLQNFSELVELSSHIPIIVESPAACFSFFIYSPTYISHLPHRFMFLSGTRNHINSCMEIWYVTMEYTLDTEILAAVTVIPQCLLNQSQMWVSQITEFIFIFFAKSTK